MIKTRGYNACLTTKHMHPLCMSWPNDRVVNTRDQKYWIRVHYDTQPLQYMFVLSQKNKNVHLLKFYLKLTALVPTRGLLQMHLIAYDF